MLQMDKPDDYVLATGEQYSIRDFVEEAFAHCGFDIEWRGEGMEEKGVDKNSGRTLIEVDPKYYRPTEVETLLGDPSKAKRQLGWKPEVGFKELVKIMVTADLELKGVNL